MPSTTTAISTVPKGIKDLNNSKWALAIRKSSPSQATTAIPTAPNKGGIDIGPLRMGGCAQERNCMIQSLPSQWSEILQCATIILLVLSLIAAFIYPIYSSGKGFLGGLFDLDLDLD